jgi:hypothetical protein
MVVNHNIILNFRDKKLKMCKLIALFKKLTMLILKSELILSLKMSVSNIYSTICNYPNEKSKKLSLKKSFLKLFMAFDYCGF